MKRLKQEKGVTGVDISVAVIIIVLFVGTISALFYGIYLSNASTKRATIATNYAIDILEKIEMTPYEEVNIENLDTVLKEVSSLQTLSSQIEEEGNTKKMVGEVSGYTIRIELQNYTEQIGNEAKQDVIKIVKLRIEYPIGKKIGFYEVNRLKTR